MPDPEGITVSGLFDLFGVRNLFSDPTSRRATLATATHFIRKHIESELKLKLSRYEVTKNLGISRLIWYSRP
jgi:hypothetical protein